MDRDYVLSLYKKLEALERKLGEVEKAVTQCCRDCIDVWEGDSGRSIVVQAADYINSSFQHYIKKQDKTDQLQNRKETGTS